jgi:hypothetical protein
MEYLDARLAGQKPKLSLPMHRFRKLKIFPKNRRFTSTTDVGLAKSNNRNIGPKSKSPLSHPHWLFCNRGFEKLKPRFTFSHKLPQLYVYQSLKIARLLLHVSEGDEMPVGHADVSVIVIGIPREGKQGLKTNFIPDRKFFARALRSADRRGADRDRDRP